MDGQCQAIWGAKSYSADPACFRQFNSGGTISGNCGRMPSPFGVVGGGVGGQQGQGGQQQGQGGGFIPCDRA